MTLTHQPNVFKKFWYFLTFKTHHKNLLTTGGASYLTVISVIVSLAAFSEAFAWGHFGSTFTPETPLLGGIGLGVFIFLLFWFFDRTMATQDMLSNEHAYTLEGEEKPKNIWFKFKIGTWIIFVARLCIVIGSLYITAPFLTQLVFSSDIKKEMEQQYKNNIEIAKENTIGVLDNKINEQQNHIKNLHDKLQQEIGGKRGTGYGKGEVAKSIEAEIASIDQELSSLKSQRQNTEITINQAIIDNDFQTLKSFGIFVVQDSPIFREQAVEKLKSQPAFISTKQAVEGFLIIVGLILILAKLLQPKSLQMYYSSRLQEAWINYQKGNYDDYLPNSEKSINMPDNPMPQTFEKIAIRYAKTKDEREKDALKEKERAKSLKQQQEERRLQLEQEQEEKRIRLENSRQEYAEHHARELQSLSYEDKTTNYHKRQIKEAKQAIVQQMTLFKQENETRKNELFAKRQTILEEIAEATRIYQSKQEDAKARQERLANAKHKLEELHTIAQALEGKGRDSLENVKSYAYTQDSIDHQKQHIKNLQDNYLTFERDINFYEQKLQNLYEQKTDIDKELLFLKQKWDALKQAYHNQELKEIELLGKTDFNTPYIHGTEEEIPHMAEKVKNEEPHYYYYTDNKNVA